MPRGGARLGAGRKKGSSNKATAVRRERAIEMIRSGNSPLDFMLAIMWDEKADFRARFEAAKSALPYLHPRLIAIDGATKNENTMTKITNVMLKLETMSETEKMRRIATWIHEATLKRNTSVDANGDLAVPGGDQPSPG
jgi:hypothetical protein